MRIIKFRAWDKKKKEMFSVKAIDFTANSMLGVKAPMVNKADSQHDWVSFDDIELMQYTGLKDKNGKEIYEGDILKITRPESSHDSLRTRVVEWQEKSNYIGWNIGIGLDKLSGKHSTLRKEIIGNIYENIDLLNKGCKK